MNEEIKKNEDLGYDDFFEFNRKKLKLDNFLVARVIVEYRGVYKVKNSDHIYLARVTGKRMFEAGSREDFPAVGDWVAISEADKEQAVIQAILPRRTIIKRKSSGKNEVQVIATNIDVALVVESIDRDFNLNRFERYFAIAKDGGIKPAIVLNKIDLISQEELDLIRGQIKDRFGEVDLIFTSIVTNERLDDLKKYIKKGQTYCFLGSSGVGKSSLINKLLGKDTIKTEVVGSRTIRGKHTTTNREIYFLENGGIVIDNPGMREVGMTDTDAGIDDLFDEITNLAKKCRFVDCTHVHEPGCEVLSALEAGRLNADRYSNYINLKKESEYYEMTDLERRQEDRQFGKFLKKAKKDLGDYGYKNYGD